MASVSVDLPVTGVAFIDSYFPDRNVHDARDYAFSADADREQRLFIKFQAPDASIAKYALERIYEPLMWKDGATDAQIVAMAPRRAFDPNTITWNSRTGGDPVGDVSSRKAYPFKTFELPAFWSSAWSTAAAKSEGSARLLKYGGFYVRPENKRAFTVTEYAGLNVSLYYNDAVTVNSTISPVNCITEGYLNPHTAQEFAYEFLPIGQYHRVGPVVPASVALNWRSGTSGTWNTVSPASLSTGTITVPANTFPSGGTVQWTITAIDDTGYSSQTATYTVSTTDSQAVATPVNPVGTVEDGSAPILFRWNARNESGTTCTGATIQVTDSTLTTRTQTISGSGTEYELAAETLAAGSASWRVKTANSDGVYGDYSEWAEFVVVAAPAAPVVTVSGKSWGTINWQGSGQQAYRITLNGETYGPYFGTEQSWSWPVPLESDITATATVEIQGGFGLWSQPGSTSWNTGAATTGYIVVTGVFGTDAELNWTDRASASSINLPYFVWRDGKLIGKTNEMSFRDRFVLGQHSYYVTRRRTDNRVALSNTVTGTLKSCSTRIAAFDGGSWTELELNEESYGLQVFSWARTAVARHVAGTALPVVEMSPYEDGAGSYTVAFRNMQEAQQLEALKGRIVILKSRGGQVLVGALVSLQKSMKDFFITYSFTIQRIHWEDFVDDSNG